MHLLFFLSPVHSQNISFQKVGLADGLSQVSVLAIHQDHLNRMWFGTRNGLNCWDGVRMKQFYPDDRDSTTLKDHNIIQIVQLENSLWLRSNMGQVSRLDLETLTFKKYILKEVKSITVQGKSLTISTSKDVFVYNAQKDSFDKYPEIYGGDKSYTVVYKDRHNVLWVADQLNNQIIRIDNDETEIIPLPLSEAVSILDLLLDYDEKLWIATRYNGILIYDGYNKTFETVNEDSQPFYLKDNTVRDLIEDRNGRIWAGTFKGLAIFDLRGNSTSFIEASDDNNNGLSHNSVHCIYLSNDDNIWIGTYFGGVNVGRISNQIFTVYSNQSDNQKPSYPVIGPMVEDEDGNIWIGTEGGGLDFFDRTNRTFTNYGKTNTSAGPSQTNIKSLFLWKRDLLLIGVFQGGLNTLNLKTGEFSHFNNSIKHVEAIIPYRGDFLLATERGVKRFNPDNGVFSDFLSSEEYGADVNSMLVKALFQDSRNVIWIGTGYSGLISFNPKTKELKRYQHSDSNELSLSSNRINCMMEDHLFRLWIGTNDGGLCLYNDDEDNFTSFNKSKNNLPSDFVFGIAESRYGNLWIATSKGLSRFDVENDLFFNYESESGFPLEELNYAALLQTRDGEIFVGGINGLISFKERDLILLKSNFEILISMLEVNNKEVRANDKSKILTSDISTTKSFTLMPEHSVFKISYSACNYNVVFKNKYQYKLEGFDQEWINAEYNTSVNYTNLNPGKYTLKIRSTDVVYQSSSEVKTMDIIVRPPFYQTWAAYVFYAVILSSLLLLFNNFYLGKVRLAYQLNNEREEKNRIKELNLYKLRFFTNISHEFMTPLTIILNAIEQISSKNKIPQNFRNPLAQIIRNAKRLKNLNRELLDFRKIEQGHLKLKIQENDIVPYLEDIYNAFSEMAHKKNIDYSFDKNTDHVSAWYDSIQMDKVFYNLLSNAFNHVTKPQGHVRIVFENQTDKLLITVRDNGEGIPKDEIERIFDRFFQLDHKKEYNEYYGSGIGLALSQSIVKAHHGEIACESTLGKGTTFTVTLLKGHQHFDPELISDDKAVNQFSMDKDLVFYPAKMGPTDQNDERELSSLEAPVLLIVDDNPEMRDSIKNLFVDKYHIEVANDGNEGFDKALELQPDIIIADVKMPKLSGFEMCKMLKRNINTSHIPVVLVTALVGEEDHVKGFECGADAYITKPYSSSTLIARIENLFRNRKILQDKFSQDINLSTKSMAKSTIDRVFLENAQRICEEHIMDSEFSVTLFASEMGMSRTLFFRKIKTITGQTPNDFVQTIRLKKAADILINDPSKNVSEIAYSIGFNSPRYFSQCFRNHFGVIPSKFVKSEIKET